MPDEPENPPERSVSFTFRDDPNTPGGVRLSCVFEPPIARGTDPATLAAYQVAGIRAFDVIRRMMGDDAREIEVS